MRYGVHDGSDVSIPHSVLFLSRVDICLIYPRWSDIYVWHDYFVILLPHLLHVPNMWTLTYLLRQIPICVLYSFIPDVK